MIPCAEKWGRSGRPSLAERLHPVGAQPKTGLTASIHSFPAGRSGDGFGKGQTMRLLVVPQQQREVVLQWLVRIAGATNGFGVGFLDRSLLRDAYYRCRCGG